jgi:hypothetical protein
MAYSYTPRAEPERLGPGIHTVEVCYTLETTSKKGNPMIELHLLVEGFDIKPLKAYMVLSESSAWKTRQMRNALGFEDPIDTEVVIDHDEMLNRRARVRLEKPEGSKYLEITEWLSAPETAAAPVRKPAPVDLDGDEVPF